MSSRNFDLRTFACLAALLALPAEAEGAGAEPERNVADFLDHVETVAPELLRESSVPGAAVAVVHDGRTVYLSGFGLADPSSGTRVGPETLFNVGSVSKTVTAWGVMSLVEKGGLELDDLAARHLSAWPLAAGEGARSITVRHLLEHTGGLTAPSVPEYLPWERVVDLREWLAESGEVRLAGTPGRSWAYSGAGYSLLQLVVESVAGRGFGAAMRDAVFAPLGMQSSSFDRPAPDRPQARPHEAGEPIPIRRYSGLAAAGLYTSATDLARFLEAHSESDRGPAGRGVVSAGGLRLLSEPTPLSRSPFNTSYGMGYDLWPLASGSLTAGHRGQNHGWSAVAWLSADARDGLAVLTNDSNGEEFYRWIFCDWARWLDGASSFGGYCAARGEHITGSLFEERERPSPELRSLVERAAPQPGPGIAVSLTRGEKVVLRDAVGAAEVGTGVEIRPSTPFYLASLAKPMTAMVILRLVASGDLALDDFVEELLPEARSIAAGVTIRRLLQHQSGVPDYWSLLDWSRLPALDNLAAVRWVADHAESSPGWDGSFEYSNTGYLMLAAVAERIAGRRFAELLEAQAPCTSSSSSLFVLDAPEIDLPQRARGYGSRDGASYVSDYRLLARPGYRPLAPRFSTVGSGGVTANVEALRCWGRAVLAGGGLPEPLARLAVSAELVGPDEIEGLGSDTRVGPVFFASTVEGKRVLWFDGALFGHRSLLVMEPDEEIVLVLLANSAEIDLRRLAIEMLHALL